ncbi:hypothetical protein ACIRPK_28920 [Kitasatospora sp. NPDC101801]|uniref:hypothetical protein n=1 Tax=Kitasatospora sp. NPDC101801 TaxID=3364103 RepID=UPI00381DCF1D
MFEEELREQLDQARRAVAEAREAGDEDGVEAYQGRVAALIRIAAHHGIALPHTPEEEGD